MAESNVSVPSGFGGLMRFTEDYDSIFNLKPSHVVIFVFLIVVLRIALEVVY
jgi:preprotein translocase subunit Sec61beta|tara:strand:+ start:101 stop:256 length:156 start_codon:yes stop_codon:yes gene_type:complete